MLTFAKIKDPKGRCYVNFYLLHICFIWIYQCIYTCNSYFFAEKYLLSVQNIKHGSKLYVNTDIAKIQQFCDKYDARI